MQFPSSSITLTIIAVIDMSAKITALCYQYSKAVKSAKDDIEPVQQKANDITLVLEKIRRLLDGHNKTRLSITLGLSDSLRECLGGLEELKVKLEPGEARKTINRVGLGALKSDLLSVRQLSSN
jgi:hypothetical protein